MSQRRQRSNPKPRRSQIPEMAPKTTGVGMETPVMKMFRAYDYDARYFIPDMVVLQGDRIPFKPVRLTGRPVNRDHLYVLPRK